MPSSKTGLLSLILISIVFASSQHHDLYFQQHCNYRIQAELDVALKRIDAKEELIYWNHSPDTLQQLYFHLYLNRYRSTAFTKQLHQQRDFGGIEIFMINENNQPQTDFSIDQTLMKIHLREPLLPGDSVKFDFKFSSKLPPASGRYGYMGDHFDVGNWFPTPVVYDRAGWHLHQHLDNEFYQEWADFEVNIRVPKGFVVGATGNLLNPDQALPDTAQTIKDHYFQNPDDTSTTIWKFKAEMVHDFAWTADPEYVLLQNEWNGITLNLLVMPENVEGWKQVLDWGVEALKFLYKNYGPYPYQQMTIADTYVKAGGMEYPNIVFINTFINPEFALNRFRAVVIHEMAHNWYYGLLANNQTEEEWLDEGLTSFAEIECMEALFGREDNYSNNRDDWFSRTFYYENNDRKDNALAYLWWAKSGQENDPIDLMPDYLGEDSYISQYSKMAKVILMLQYVMGDSLFRTGLQNYYRQWHFKHPYPADFIAAMEETAQRDLDWFFEQWLKTNRQLDYAIDKVRGTWIDQNDTKMYQAEVQLKNLGEIFMPIDLDIRLKNGQTKHYQIPVDPSFKNPLNRPVLPYWHFSQKIYRTEINLEDEIDYVEIDESQRLMDVNRLNNRSGLIPPMDFVLMRPQSNAPPLNAYLWEGWPLIFYNDIDMAKIGFKLEGGYLNVDHLLNISLWFKTANYNLDFDLTYEHPVQWLGNRSSLGLRAYTLDGHQGAQIRFSKQIGENRYREPFYRLNLSIKNHQLFNENYPLSAWEKGNINTIELNWSRLLDSYWSRKTNLSLHFLNSIMGSDFNFSKVELHWSAQYLSVYHDYELLLNFRAGLGSENIPLQHLFALAGAQGWELFDNEYYRARGTLYYPWFRQGYLFRQNGAQVRGYSLYPEDSMLLGKKTLMVSGDLILPNPLDISSIYILRDLIPSVFFDIGQVWDVAFPDYLAFRKSAGFSLSWNRFFMLDYFIPIDKVQLDFPLWMSHVPEGNDPFDFRWLLRFDFDL